jgi:hypothetical protein
VVKQKTGGSFAGRLAATPPSPVHGKVKSNQGVAFSHLRRSVAATQFCLNTQKIFLSECRPQEKMNKKK